MFSLIDPPAGSNHEAVAMKQLNVAATFVAACVLTVFVLTCWLFESRPFRPPAAAVEAPAAMRDSEEFGGKFGVRDPSRDRRGGIGSFSNSGPPVAR